MSLQSTQTLKKYMFDILTSIRRMILQQLEAESCNLFSLTLSSKKMVRLKMAVKKRMKEIKEERK